MTTMTEESVSTVKTCLNPVLPSITRHPQTYQPRLRVFLLPTIRCGGWRAETGVSTTGRLGFGGGCRGGVRRRKHSPRGASQLQPGRTQWPGGWREETWKPATAGVGLRQPDRLHKRSTSRSGEAQPAFVSRHDDQSLSFNAEHCGEKQAGNNSPSDQSTPDSQHDSPRGVTKSVRLICWF